MIRPVLMDDEFLLDVSEAAKAPDCLHLWWLGQSGFLVQWQGAHLLLDPYLSDSLTAKYAGTDKPHVRVTERVVDPQRLDFIDVVASSHNHTDHLDGDTIRPLLAQNPGLVVLVSEANREFAAARLQVSIERLTGIATGASVQVGAFTFHAIPSAHEVLEADSRGNHKFIGYVVAMGPWTLYHPGDTLRYPGMAEILGQRQIDLALLPINGRDPGRGVAGNLTGVEAVELARDIRASLVIPCHYEMFAFNTASPDLFIRTANELRQPYRVLKCGERFTLEAQQG
jgi:L-ascorbate metabolism protein UlaG (beta-lactamase superfamily)